MSYVEYLTEDVLRNKPMMEQVDRGQAVDQEEEVKKKSKCKEKV